MSIRVPESLRTQIDATDRRSCCYCLTSEAVSGTPLTYDHITPASRGGLTTFVVALRMNHALIVAARRRWFVVGWHPPAIEPKRR